QPPESPWTVGVGLFAVGGFAVNYPSSVNNPFLTPQPPNGVGVGNLFAQYQILQLTPTVAYQLTEHLSVGAGLTADLATLLVDPFVFATPDDGSLDGFRTFPAGGTHSRLHWGVGFQAGLFWAPERDWGFGVSVKSPQWFETFGYNGVDELGRR